MNTFPDGWNEEKVQSVINYYSNQTEEEEISEDEAPFKEKNHTFVEVPQELVPEIRKLIASYKLENNKLLERKHHSNLYCNDRLYSNVKFTTRSESIQKKPGEVF